ncbi:hypothetical protein BHE74_00030416 [Ensete ventricosum]|nr:hypothetical protein BHE74_00030416 [Ensete ventricosum]
MAAFVVVVVEENRALGVHVVRDFDSGRRRLGFSQTACHLLIKGVKTFMVRQFLWMHGLLQTDVNYRELMTRSHASIYRIIDSGKRKLPVQSTEWVNGSVITRDEEVD